MHQHFESYRQTLIRHLEEILKDIVQVVIATKMESLGVQLEEKEQKNEELLPVSAFQVGIDQMRQELKNEQIQSQLKEKKHQ